MEIDTVHMSNGTETFAVFKSQRKDKKQDYPQD